MEAESIQSSSVDLPTIDHITTQFPEKVVDTEKINVNKNRRRSLTFDLLGADAEELEQSKAKPPVRRSRRSIQIAEPLKTDYNERSRPRRLSVKPACYRQEETKRSKQPTIFLEVGAQPVGVKPILRKPSSQAAAKKVARKYKQKSIQFNSKCKVNVITPIPGWKDGRVRMPESDEEEILEGENTKPLRLSEALKITPDSCRKLATLDWNDSPLAPVSFNVDMIFGDENDQITPIINEKPLKRKPRKRSIAPQQGLDMLNDSTNYAAATSSQSSILSSDDSNKDDVVNVRKFHEVVIPTEVAILKPVNGNRRRSMKEVNIPPNDEKIDKMTAESAPAAKKSRRRSSVYPIFSTSAPVLETPPKDVNTKESQKMRSFGSGDSPCVSISNWLKKEKTVSNETNKVFPLSEYNGISSVEDPEIQIISSSLSTSSSIEILNDESYTDTVLTNEVIPVREQYKNQIKKEHPKKKHHLSEFDYAPFSPCNYLPSFSFAPVIDEWTLNLRTPVTNRPDLKLTDIKQFIVNETNENISPIPFTMPDDVEELVDSFSVEENQWYQHAKKCKDDAETLPWSDALRPISTDIWMGPAHSSMKAKKFVKYWLRRVEKEAIVTKNSSKKKKRFCDSDSDYEEDIMEDRLSNPLILCGPSGSGKSSLIAALCSELNCKTLEVHAGELRNATSLKQKLSGAGESQRMQSTNSITSFFTKTSQPSSATTTSRTIIVVEDVDVYFTKHDKDFFTTLKNLAMEAKVPVIWTCSTLPYDELNREPEINNVDSIMLEKPTCDKISSYASVCAFALSGIYINPVDMKRLVKKCNNNLKAIFNDLQFWLSDITIPLNFSSARDVSSESFDINYLPRTTYPDAQTALELRRRQLYEIMENPSFLREQVKRSNLMGIMKQSLKNYSENDLATDYLPLLVHIDRTQDSRKRRQLHYFQEVNKDVGLAIDTDGNLTPHIRKFGLKLN